MISTQRSQFQEGQQVETMNSIAYQICDLGTKGSQLIIDALVIGIQLGRACLQRSQIKYQVMELIEVLKKFSYCIEKGFIPQNRREDLYNTFLLNPNFEVVSNSIQQLLQEIKCDLENHQKASVCTMIFNQIIEDEFNNLKPQSQINPDEQLRNEQILNDEQISIDNQQQTLELAKNILREFEEDQLSDQLARELQSQFDDEVKTFQLLQQIQLEEQQNITKQDEMQNQQKDCNICLDKMDFDEIWPLNCSHIYHRFCLNKYFQGKIKERDFPLRCPENECKKQIVYQDMTETLDDSDLDLYYQHTFKQYIDQNSAEMSWCPTPDCDYAFAFQNDDTELNCPRCEKQYCLQCKVEFHKKQTCAEYRQSIINEINNKANDQLFLKFVQGSKFKQCPSCRFWVEKNQGCDHMTCRCKYQFCYVCGGQYGKCRCKQ